MNLIYKGQNLFVDNTSVKRIAKNNITPFYVYSHKKIKNNFVDNWGIYSEDTASKIYVKYAIPNFNV